MKKLLAKIIGATTALAMAIGVGFAVGNNRMAKQVDAAAQSVSWTATSGGLGTEIGSGTITTGGYSWSYTRTLISGTSYSGWTSNCIQLGKNGGVENLTLTTSSIPGMIKSVSVECSSYNGAHKVAISVGGDSYLSATNTATWTAVNAKSGTGTSSGTIIISFTDGSRALYVKSITVSYDAGGEEPPEPTGFTVSFDANGGGSSMSDVSDVTGDYNLPANGFTAPSGKAFIGWKANNSGDLIAPEESYDVTADVTFYAQWEDRYTVRYYSNGGSGTITDSTSYAPSATVTVKDSTGFTAPFADTIFDKWNTAADGSGQDYAPGATFNIASNTSLYAQWKDDPSIPYTNVYSTGFESGDGFTATTTYNSEKDDGPSGKQWHIYYGTASSNSPLIGSQSLQMRWYGSAPENIPYAQTSFSSTEVKRVTFSYKAGNKDIDFKTQYRTNSGDAWTDIETVNTANTNVNIYRKIFDTPIASLYFRILLCEGTAPSGGAKPEFIIDNVYFDSVAIPATINGNSTVQVGTQWSPTDITENAGEHSAVTGVTYSFTTSNGAVISASNTSTGAFTCSHDGTVTVNATKSGYIITGKTITVQPADPFVNDISKASTNGFVGQNETITFSYGNLTGSLNVISNNESFVTVETPVCNAGSGSVQLNFVGVGSTTVVFKDGDSLIDGASISVSVAASTVTITGMPSSKLMGNGTSLNFSNYITVTSTGICSDDIIWLSSDPDVASVNGSGVVTAAAIGSTVVTARPEDYPAGAVSCTITVVNEKASLAESISSGDIVFLGSRAASMQYNGPSSTSTVYGLGTAFVDSPNVGGLALEVVDGKVDNSFAFKIKSGDYENKYLTWLADNSLNVADAIDDNSSWNVAIDGDGNASITNVNTPARTIWWNNTNPRFACYINKGAMKDVQLWKLDNPESHLGSKAAVKTLHGHENYTDAVLTSVDSVVIRFGATIAKSDWNAIASNWEITDYGVMLIKENDLDNAGYLTVEEAFNNNVETIRIVNKRASGAAYADPYEDGDNYLFTVKINFPEDDSYYDDYIFAAPFIVAGGQYYFLAEISESVKSLANLYFDTGYAYLSDDALAYLG